MSALFSHQAKLSEHEVEGTVLSVDAPRFLCTVKTIRGQRLNNVTWTLPSGGYGRSSTASAPKMGDRVIVDTGLGYPVIRGFLPRIDRNASTPPSIDGGSLPADTGNLGSLSGASLNASRPTDFIPGDEIITSEGGGLLGVLRSGTIMLRSSRLAQIILSKLDDGVKIVARSLDIHTEVSSEIMASVKGRVYKWLGIARTPAEARQGLFRYQEFYGDTLTAAALKDNYELGGVGSLGVGGGPMKKVLVVDANQVPLRIEEVDMLGNVTTKTTLADGSAWNTVGYTNGEWNLQVNAGVFCNIKVTSGEVFVTYNGDPTLKLNAQGIFTKMGSTEIKQTTDSIMLEASGHFVRITPSGVAQG